MKRKAVLQFICYSPRIYSGFDRYNVVLAQKLVEKGFQPVFIFTDSISYVPAIGEDLEAVGVKIEFISSVGKFKLFFAILRLFLKYKPTIVHTHFVNNVKIITAFLSVMFCTKFFVSFHSTISLIPSLEYQKEKGVLKRRMLLIYYRFLLFCSKRIFTVSEAIKNQFIDFASSNSLKVHKLYLGVDLKKNTLTKVELRSLLKLPQDKVLVCNISAFEHIKGLDIMCKAVSILKMEYKLDNFVFCHLGGLRIDNEFNRNYRDSIYKYVNELEIENEVNWLGHRNDIGEIMSAFDIYVHPSRMEGLGLANMEAATQSIPIVGTNIGGIPEIVLEGMNGFLFKSENAEDLANCLNKLITDEKLRYEFGEQSLRIVESNFNIESQSDKLLDFYLNS